MPFKIGFIREPKLGYTIGIKRRWLWPKRVRVTRHAVEDGRLILNKVDGRQEHYFSLQGFVVYDDIWTHESNLRRDQFTAERLESRVGPLGHTVVSPVRQGAFVTDTNGTGDQQSGIATTGQETYDDRPIIQPKIDPLHVRAQQIASQRVANILASDGPSQGFPS